ncbi:MAG TPA: thioredoxin domain-containing protein [Candidatus Saccharimonadales bacterium]|nr:thioredoxin domain-containing protein [Candidatus Saccharimonadales bacterium]
MGKKFWIALLLVAVGFMGFLWVDGGKHAAEQNNTSASTAPVTHSTGKQDAAVTLVEYSDFQCPACGAYYPVVEQIVEKYKGRISFEYRHYPLTTVHHNAFAAARASEAASKQGKFWEMYRLLFANQSNWAELDNPQATFEGYAKRLGLAMGRYRVDFAGSETNGAINASIHEFNTRGLPKSTPTFLLNGKKIQPRDLQDFSKIIDAQLKAAQR